MNSTLRHPLLVASFPLSSGFDVSEAHIAELKRQNALLLEQVGQLSAIVRQVPTLLTRARMDQAQGIPTVYDYRASSRALAVR